MQTNKKSDEKLEELLKAALTLEMEPGEEVNRQILQSWKERNVMTKQKRKSWKVAIAAAACVMLTGVTVGAAVHYLNAVELAEEMGNDTITAAFRGENAMYFDEAKESGDYRVTLLGITTGDRLVESDLSEAAPELGSTYAALAIERIDGTPMPNTSDDAYGDLEFFISPLIQGLTPWHYNIAGGICGGYSDTVKNGVLYRIIECDDIMMFADRTLYLCVSDTTFYDTMAYNYDEASGVISPNESYEGMNLLFTLPIDPSRADPAAAAAYLSVMEDKWNPEDGDEADTEASGSEPWEAEAQELCDQITEQIEQGKKEEALAGASKMEEAQLTLKNGRYEYTYEESTEESDGEESSVSGGTYYFYPEDFVNGRGVMASYDFDNEGMLTGFTFIIVEETGDKTAAGEVWKLAM